MKKSQEELEKMDYAELSTYRSAISKNVKGRFEIDKTLPYPKSLNDLSHQEIQAMTKEEKEKFKSDYQKGKSEVVKKREEEYQKQFTGTSLDWIDKRLSQLYAEVPNEIRYKEDLDYLNEAKASAISNEHKRRIDYYAGEIKAGRDVSDIIRYKLPALWYMGAKQFVSTLIKRLGGERYHKSEKTVKGSVYYQLPNHDTIRISDHELPDTEQRQYNRSQGIGGKWIEIVLDTPKPFSELRTEILNLFDEQVGEGEQSKGFEKETEQIKAKIKEMKGEMEFGGIVEPVNTRLEKSIECCHKPTQKGSKCTRRHLNSIGKCWQHI